MFVPLSVLIGGPHMAGHGWRMLVECLSVGRAISLPSNATGAARMAVAATGAYARMRKQFGLAIGRFEGVEEALARIGGLTYATAALSRATAAAVDRGEKPAVPSAIAKYHATEWCRIVAGDAMDVHGGKGVILGPKNYMGRGWQSVPIAITVEGANIMTRSLMIFGQGAIRCHPYVLKEMQALAIADYGDRLKHLRQGAVRSHRFRRVQCGAQLRARPDRGEDRRDRRRCLHAALLPQAQPLFGGARAVCRRLDGRARRQAEVQGKTVGPPWRRAELSSTSPARCSSATRTPAVRKRIVRCWPGRFHECVWRMQMALDGVIRNFPVRPVAWLLRALVFPFGRREVPPSDRLGRRVAALITAPSEARDRLTEWTYLTPSANNTVGRMNALLPDVIAAEPVERKFVKALKSGQIKAHDVQRPADRSGEARRDQCRRVRAAATRARCRRRVHLGRRFRCIGTALGGRSWRKARAVGQGRLKTVHG